LEGAWKKDASGENVSSARRPLPRVWVAGSLALSLLSDFPKRGVFLLCEQKPEGKRNFLFCPLSSILAFFSSYYPFSEEKVAASFLAGLSE